MDPDERSTAALEEELHQVETDLAELRRIAAELRREVGERRDQPADVEDQAVLITAAEEQEALAEQLANRRERLLARLGRR